MLLLRDVGLAEDFAQEALLIALERLPAPGIPDNPGAWLMATARNHAGDEFGRRQMRERKHEEVAAERSLEHLPRARDIEPEVDEHVGDDQLRLILSPVIRFSPRRRAPALTLRLLGGLTTAEIARAFLAPEPTIAQRIVRAKRTLAEACVPFEVPRGEDLSTRLSSVLEVIASSSTRDARRRAGTTGCGRSSAKTRYVSGEFWPSWSPRKRRFTGTAEETDWERIVALYDALVELVNQVMGTLFAFVHCQLQPQAEVLGQMDVIQATAMEGGSVVRADSPLLNPWRCGCNGTCAAAATLQSLSLWLSNEQRESSHLFVEIRTTLNSKPDSIHGARRRFSERAIDPENPLGYRSATH